MRKGEGIVNTPAAPATASFSTFFIFHVVDLVLSKTFIAPPWDAPPFGIPP